ncbi:unnamed protein product [Didymodactylos carnosus]|uniref:Flavodoxin-like domain-containing protein n=1 Tax=Didymodactylos carnosus TaxID=1234261 RepID=A0A814N883_9BILA|nr:unnamed protein product [Didymodactylos carnosus]CAF1435958.1 unnamed protein product [Didymodactylos carnosus]CAF3855171.1 unnamed protein product [Didymodactylos carnosus]CAF4233290.1 unnamed protein product [Didymodactylos carnosus]
MSDRHRQEQTRNSTDASRHHGHRGTDAGDTSYNRENQSPQRRVDPRSQQQQQVDRRYPQEEQVDRRYPQEQHYKQSPQNSSRFFYHASTEQPRGPPYQNESRYQQSHNLVDRQYPQQQIDSSLSSSRHQQQVQTNESVSGRRKPVVFVIYYSMYGHVKQLAQKIIIGLEKNGVEPKLFRVNETLPRDVLDKMHASPPDTSIPVIEVNRLPEADAFMFGFPTRFGSAPAQMKTLFDSCGQHWINNTLYHKPAGLFFSTAGLGGGQETTALTTVTFLTHLGMIFVPLGYKNPKLRDSKEIRGGSAYGAGTLAGAGDRQPTSLELDIAESQGHEFADVVKKMAV